MKLLLSFVGEQDPVSNNTNEEGSIVTLCRSLKPDRVVLFPSDSGRADGDTKNGAEATAHWLATELSPAPEVSSLPLMLADPTDYAQILPQLHGRLKSIATLLQAEGTVSCLNFSSGTPQMKSVWLLLANSGLFQNCQLWQVLNPNYVGAGEDRCRELSLTFLEEEEIIGRLDVFAGQFLFRHIADDMGRLRNISLHHDRKEKAELLRQLFLAYQAWDLIQYPKAYEVLEVALTKQAAAKTHPLHSLLKGQLDYLRKLKNAGKRETPENLCDLFHNAKRLYVKGIYTDALARFWRVFEGLLYFRLREKYGIEPTDPPSSRNAKNLALLTEAFPEADRFNFAIGFNKAHVLLEEKFQDADYCGYLQQTGKFRSGTETVAGAVRTLRLGRNDSMAAHGMKPVTQEEVMDAARILETLCGKLIATAPVQAHPLRSEQIKVVTSYLTKSFFP